MCIIAKFGTCTVVSVNETLVEAKICTFTLETPHFIFNKCPIYTHDGEVAYLALNHTKRITVKLALTLSREAQGPIGPSVFKG